MNEEKLIQFDSGIEGVSVTYGYSIYNKFPIHFHTTYTLGIIESGKREFYYRGRKEIISDKNLFLIQPFEPHSCKPYNSHPHSYKIISFKLNSPFYCPVFAFNNSELKEKILRFHTLVEYKNESMEKKKLFNGIINQLIKKILICPSQIENTKSISSLEKAKQYIIKNCHKPINLQKIAKVVCLSKYDFCRKFNKYFGLSPYAYYLIYKMKKAEKLLRENKSITTSSYDLNFFDQSHFSKMFKIYIGVSPGKYLTENENS